MSKELNNLITSLSEDNFKNLIKEYNKQKYNTPHIRIVDGPYDGGNDLEIIIGDNEIKKNIQITVQKSNYESKLEEDLVKAKRNVSFFSYLNQLDFYINQNVSNDKKNQLKLKAEIDHQITLTIIDANTLAQEADNYSAIKNFTYQSHSIQTESSLLIVDKQTKILFDVLTLDSNSIEIKRNFINSYVYSYLYLQPDSTSQEIFDYLNPHVNNTLHKDFLDKELNNLRAKKTLISPVDKTKFQLSSEMYSQISEIYSVVLDQEKNLQQVIVNFLAENNITSDATELITLLYKLYQENYTIDIDELKNTNNSFSASIKKSFNDLVHYFIKKDIEQEIAKSLSEQLLKLCASNDFLNKLSSIHLFTNLYSSNKLEKYINNKTQEVLLDTQILIRMICVLYSGKFEYSDNALESVKILVSTFEKFKTKLRLITTHDYVGEVAGHLLDAFKLQRFIDLPFFEKLGKSKNVFYNTFQELKEKNYLDSEVGFGEFVDELIDEEIQTENEDQALGIISRKLTEILQLANIELIYHPNYTNYLSLKKEYEISLAYKSRIRTYNARENDLRTILYLSTKENHQSVETGEINEPFLITWDGAFYDFRKELIKTHKELSFWYIYSPLKFVDRLSVMNFTLNPKSISLNIVALTETNFNYSSKTTSFLDIISNFFNTKDVSKLSIINKLADLKSKTRNIDEEHTVEEFKDNEESSVTTLLLNLQKHYFSYESEYKFEDVISIFEIPSYESNIIKILEDGLKHIITDKKLANMYEEFDALIKESKELPLA
jgi:hypothetical protein